MGNIWHPIFVTIIVNDKLNNTKHIVGSNTVYVPTVIYLYIAQLNIICVKPLQSYAQARPTIGTSLYYANICTLQI